jgi:hypothetical protein
MTISRAGARRRELSRGTRRLHGIGLVILLVVFFLPRIRLVHGPGLWADEFFSLAIATGHSLEHPAGAADPARGDFTERPHATSPSVYARYLEHDHPPASARRVVRAVLLSDTNPPLYYLLLHEWTRLAGTSDTALRLFSVAWALACLPLMGAIALRLGGRRAVFPACLTFVASPLCAYYSTEGRMYSMLWFFAIATGWLTIQLQRKGPATSWTLMWIAASAGGLLTHYFFAFPWLACLAWILAYPGRYPRWLSIVSACLTVAVIMPWYVRLPESLGGWRVTQDWLKVMPYGYTKFSSLFSPLRTFVDFFDVPGGGFRSRAAALATFCIVGAIIVLNDRRRWLSSRRLLLWLWLLAALLGPSIFDLLRGTYTNAVPRYAIAGMPAAFLLVSIGLARLGGRVRLLLLLAITLAWLPGLYRMALHPERLVQEPYKELGLDLAGRTTSSDLVIAHSIPSGAAGLARYLDAGGASAKDVGFATWVGQLGSRRVPEDIKSLAAGRRRIFLVNIHSVGEPAPEETWLREHGVLVGEQRQGASTILEFVPGGDDRFFEDARGDHIETHRE